MKVRKAVITAAARTQRTLPLQTLIDADGVEKSVLCMLMEQAMAARVEEIAVVVWPGDEEAFARSIGAPSGKVVFVPQHAPRGYGHAILTAREFTEGEPFLHLVGDHLYVTTGARNCAVQLVEIAAAENCSVSAVQPTRENLLAMYGAVGGRPLPGGNHLYRIDTVLEKPTPTEAEQKLTVPGMRAGHYLCFFGMHVLSPSVMDILARQHEAEPGRSLTLSAALAELARREQYLALEAPGRRYDIGARYGLLIAQLAVALNGRDRAEILARIIELMADSEIAAAAGRDSR